MQGLDPKKLEMLQALIKAQQQKKEAEPRDNSFKGKCKRFWAFCKAAIVDVDFENLKHDDDMAKDLNTNLRPALKYGLGTLVVIVIAVILSMLIKLDAAATVPGKIVVSSYRKTVQSLEGGIIDEILVDDGDTVEAGDQLIVLRSLRENADLAKAYWSIRNAEAVKARLTALLQSDDVIEFEEEIKASHAVEAADIINSQTSLFYSLKRHWESEDRILEEKIAQASNSVEIEALRLESVKKQLDIEEKKMQNMYNLYENDVISKNMLSDAQLRYEDIKSKADTAIPALQIAKQRWEEANAQSLATKQARISQLEKELKDEREKLLGMEEHYRHQKDVVKRRVVTAPIAGKVVGLKTHTVGGIIQPQQLIMEVVPPIEDGWIVQAQLSPQDVNFIHEGGKAHVQLVGYKTRLSPRVDGVVTHVGADLIQDQPQSAVTPDGRPNPMAGGYYLAKIKVPKSEMERVSQDAGVEIVAGMSCTVYFVKGERSLFSFIAGPIRDSFFRAFNPA